MQIVESVGEHTQSNYPEISMVSTFNIRLVVLVWELVPHTFWGLQNHRFCLFTVLSIYNITSTEKRREFFVLGYLSNIYSTKLQFAVIHQDVNFITFYSLVN